MAKITNATVSVTLSIEVSETTLSKLKQDLETRGIKVEPLPDETDTDAVHEYAHDLLNSYYNHNDTLIHTFESGEVEITDVTINDVDTEVDEEEEA